MISLLFVGESWLGSCARSLKEALGRRTDVVMDDLSEDAWFTKPSSLWLRGLNRLTAPAYRREFNAQVMSRVREIRPDAVVTYKGWNIHVDLLKAIRASGSRSVNVYPDCSPHAHGEAHRQAVGEYDLVVSTKPYHPSAWKQVYGYSNRCEFVPQGYDPHLHLVNDPPVESTYDVAMVATWRPEYERLIVELARELDGSPISVAIGGSGWEASREKLPRHWVFPGPISGRSYISLLRRARICIAPLTREVVIGGKRQPGDEDSTRSYELPAAHCFFIHRRTEYAAHLYAACEVPMFDDASELADHIRHFLGHEPDRLRIASATHRHAVPAFSMDARVAEIINILSTLNRRST